MLKRLLLVIFLAGLFSAAWGQDFGLDLGCCSQPLTGTPVTVNGTGGGVGGYYNSLDTLITEASFNIGIGMNLGPSQGPTLNSLTVGEKTYTCTNNAFFLFCDVSYDPTTGFLTFG